MLTHEQLARKKSWKQRNREKIKAYLRQEKSKPCEDCYGLFPYYVIEFDHISGDKKFNVSRIAHRSLRSVQEEMAKCQRVCANCHRIRTHRRRVVGRYE